MSMDPSLNDKLRLLEETHKWPGPYIFKFVVPTEQKEHLRERMGLHVLESERLSKTGKYTSLTLTKRFKEPKEVLDQYELVRHIKGLISL